MLTKHSFTRTATFFHLLARQDKMAAPEGAVVAMGRCRFADCFCGEQEEGLFRGLVEEACGIRHHNALIIGASFGLTERLTWERKAIRMSMFILASISHTGGWLGVIPIMYE